MDDPIAIKVMAVTDLRQAPAVGTAVHYGQQAYTIQRALAPAAPRGWRFYLQAVAVTPAPAAPTIAIPDVPAAAPVVHASENLESVFIVEVEKLGGTNIRRSSTTLRVPYNRLSEELQRILRGGGKVVSITEGSLLH
ncbi:MAG: hypothetical protein HC926_06220 [Synechococcaceae cyanobacterium SM2_3_60]|nr:hypothetical protein [Synechococcaceae cyanobacterium SM2_3_60]